MPQFIDQRLNMDYILLIKPNFNATEQPAGHDAVYLFYLFTQPSCCILPGHCYNKQQYPSRSARQSVTVNKKPAP
jgi:hypothetical protein